MAKHVTQWNQGQAQQLCARFLQVVVPHRDTEHRHMDAQMQKEARLPDDVCKFERTPPLCGVAVCQCGARE